MGRLSASLVVAAMIACPAVLGGVAEDRAALVNGVTRIAAPGLPGSLCVFGPDAFVVVAGAAQRNLALPAIAAARLGAGRIVAFGHDGYFGPDALAVGETARLMLNAVKWAAGKESPRVAVFRRPALLRFLRQRGIKAQETQRPGADLQGFDILCIHGNDIPLDGSLERFVRSGGGLVTADTGWGWLQIHGGKTLTRDHPGNRLLAKAGLVWADGSLRRTCREGFAVQAPGDLLHAGRALDVLLSQSQGARKLSRGEVAQAAWTLSHAARSVPPDDKLFVPRLARLEKERSARIIPTPSKPLTMARPLDRVLLTLQLQRLRSAPVDQLKAHPAAKAFPGDVPADAPRVTRKLTFDTSIPAWHSTGLYAAPGEIVEATFPPRAVRAGLVVRIGAHSDRLWHHSSWRRCPEICWRFPVKAQKVRVANPFGGLIYLEVPRGCKLGKLEVEFKGAVEAPYFVLGQTSVQDWRSTVRNRPAPWAELATSKVVLTVPSRVVRKLDDPVALMKFWDQVLDACADLATIPRKRPRPERYVTDTQISAGYMHSGYPIMTMLDVAPVMVDRQRMMRNGHGGVWGLFHELGHNHQSGDWTFGGTVEVTVNLFTLYVFDKVCGRPRGSFDRIGGRRREKMLADYFKNGPDFAKWKQRPFLALIMYVQLQEAFGWDAFKRVFAEYRRLPRKERPRNDAEKRDQWLVRFSRAVGRNLGPFFQAWGVPTSEKARAQISNLPPWMPPGFPPKVN